MPISVVEITSSQRTKLISQTEGHFLDFKAIEVAPAKLSKHLSAFANADGGELYVGIDDSSHDWRGFSQEEDANGHISAFEALFPLGQDFSYTFLSCQGQTGLVLQALIQKTRDIKYATDGKPYLRRGAQSLPVTSPEALRRLEYNKGISSFESDPVNAGREVITNSLPIIKFIIDVIPTVEPEEWLRKQQLLIDSKPTVAAVLLFAEEPQAILPKRCGVKIYRYRSKESEGTRDTLAFNPLTIEGCIYEQIRDTVAKTVEIVEGIQILGDHGLEDISYPVEAIHEIITNDVLHRDYSIPDDIHIRIFDNRIEVQSPGRLPGHITPKNILRERFARNAALVRLINKFPDPPNKDVGEGLNTAFEAMRQLRLKPPSIDELEEAVLVTVRHEPLASAEEIIIGYLDNNPEITNSVARSICHIGSENAMKRVLIGMVQRELLERVPDKRGKASAYRKQNPAE